MEKTFKGQKLTLVAVVLILIGAFSRLRILFSESLSTSQYILNIALVAFFAFLSYRAFLMYTDNVKVTKHEITLTTIFGKKVINTRDIKTIDTTKNPIVLLTKNNKYARLNIPNLSLEDREFLKNLPKKKKKK